MSIETLLEAAKFLELQAQQQQKAREDELKERQRLEQLVQQRRQDVKYTSAVRVNNVPKVEKQWPESVPAPTPPSLPPPPMPITVIPIPVLKTELTAAPTLPVATLSPPAAPPPAALPRSPQPTPEAPSPAPPPCPAPLPSPVPPPSHKQVIQNHQQHHQQPPQLQPQPQQLLSQTNTTLQQHSPPQLLQQRYPGSIVSPPQQQQQQQHALLAQTSPVLQQNGAMSRASPPDDGRHLDSKKRPGGAGTREVHNKLEKNRRAHLKECFETLKKNIPNIDEKKTSNLSVLRSALRYIQTLKRKEKEYEHDMERLAREKIAMQQRLAELKNELSQWMDVVEIDRVLRQTVQPEEDQASTSTASEGEDVLDEDLDDEPPPRAPPALPAVPETARPEQLQPAAPSQPPPQPPAPPTPTMASSATSFVSIQHKAAAPQLHPPPPLPASKPAAPATSATPAPPQPLLPAQTPMVTMSSLHPTVIAHASVSHPSVIQAVQHASSAAVQLAPGHITVHPVAHLPALYPTPQPAVVGHIAHTISHAHPQVNGAAAGPPPAATATIVGKQAQMVAHHPQLVGQTVLNPVTMVTMPSFPISTLKLA